MNTGNCALTQGYSLGCREAVGGIEWVAFAPFANKGTLTESSGTVISLSLTSGQFFKYEQEQEVAQFTETETINDQNGTIYYQQELSIATNGLTAAMRNELKLLAANRLLAIVKDRNGDYWLLGNDYSIRASAGTASSGTAMADRSGYTKTFIAMNKNPMLKVSASVISFLGLA